MIRNEINITILIDNPFVSDTRVEKEIEVLIKNFNAHIKVIAISNPNELKKENKNGYTIERIINDIVKSPLKKGYKQYVSEFSKMLANEKVEILHCHDYHMLFIGSEVKRLNPNIKLIYDSHEYLKGWPLYLTNKGIFNKIKGYIVWTRELTLEKKAAQNADLVITVTDGIADRLKMNLRLNTQPIVLNNFPLLINCKEGDLLRKNFNIAKGKTILIHSGSIYYSDKQLAQLLDIIKRYNDTVLVFIGNRPRFHEIRIAVEKDIQFNKNVFFLPYPSDYASLFPILCSGDIGLLHIRNNWQAHKLGSANKLMEYSHAGLAIISTHQTTAEKINEYFHHCTFYDESNFKEFEMALIHTMNNLASFKNKALQTREKLSWGSESIKLVHAYNNLLNA
ncbi:MAG TPA: hypothetical protein EYN89_12365 [Flavobacteriales bacterium]|nr:hypothetical protein [Flavobacteriales bacterium]